MHIDRAITDNRTARDAFSIASRSALPFGSGYRSSTRSLGSSATTDTEYRLFPATALGQPILYGEPSIAASTAFPNGLSQVLIPRLGSNPLPPGTASLVAIGCTASLSLGPPNGPRAIVTNVSANAALNISTGLPLPTNAIALEMAVDCCESPCPWIALGLSGYSIVSLADRPLSAGELLLPGISPAIATLTPSPTFPEVLLFLWLAVYGSSDGLGLASIQKANLFCRSRGLFYNGDVRPDRFEAWIYQAAHSHGCRVSRSRNGLTLGAMGAPTLDATARLLTSVNSRSLTRMWEYGDRTPQSRARYGVRHSQEVSTVFNQVFMPTRSEELLGVRTGDSLHIETIAGLWEQERSLDTQYSFELATGNIGLALDSICAISDGTAPRSWQGYALAQTPQGVQGNWDGVLISGKSDTVTASTLIDGSKIFDRVTVGDTLELSTAGSVVHSLVTSALGSVVSFSPALATVPIEASYRILQTSGPVTVSWQLPGQAVAQATVTPAYYSEARSVVYPLSTTLPKGTPLVVGELEVVRVTRIAGAIVGAIG